MGQSPTTFFMRTCGDPITYRLLLVLLSFICFAYVLTTVDSEQPTNRAMSEILVPNLRVITIWPLSKLLKYTAFPLYMKANKRMVLHTHQHPLNTTPTVLNTFHVIQENLFQNEGMIILFWLLSACKSKTFA